MPDGAQLDSHNHHFFGDIVRWFIREIAGLRVRDCRTVVLHPAAFGGITSAEAWYELPAGRVSVRWKTDEAGGMQVVYGCPDGVDCLLELPDGATCQRERSGKK